MPGVVFAVSCPAYEVDYRGFSRPSLVKEARDNIFCRTVTS